MNLVQKKNLWVIKTVQVMRIINTRSNCSQKSGSCAGSPVQTQLDVKGSGDPIKTTTCGVAPNTLSNEECEHVRITREKALEKQGELDKQTGEFMNRYYAHQVKYFRKMAKINNVAMKQIKKLRKDWLKFCEKHF